jgi:hypothetical protein
MEEHHAQEPELPHFSHEQRAEDDAPIGDQLRHGSLHRHASALRP